MHYIEFVNKNLWKHNMQKSLKKEEVEALFARNDEIGRYAVGKALLCLFRRQTESEKAANTTNTHNDKGFTQADAKSGCISAKYFLKHGRLEDWQMRMWRKKNKNGSMRISKYWAQLAEEAANKKKNDSTIPFDEKEYAQLKDEYTMSVDSDDDRIIKPHAYRLREFEKKHGIKNPYIIHGAAVA